MPFDGYLEIGDEEIVNSARTLAYTRAEGIGVIKDCHDCEDLSEALGQEYVSPAEDRAPWYDPTDPITGDFFGVFPLGIEGLTDSTRQTQITELVGNGSVRTDTRRAGRDFQVRGLAFARSREALERGMSWLDAVIDPDKCRGAMAKVLAGCPEQPDLNASAFAPVEFDGTDSAVEAANWQTTSGQIAGGTDGVEVLWDAGDPCPAAWRTISGLIPGQHYQLRSELSQYGSYKITVANDDDAPECNLSPDPRWTDGSFDTADGAQQYNETGGPEGRGWLSLTTFGSMPAGTVNAVSDVRVPLGGADERNLTFQISSYVMAPAGTTVELVAQWMDDAETQLGEDVVASVSATGGWDQLTGEVTAPDAAYQMTYEVRYTFTAAPGPAHRLGVWGARVAPSGMSTYFDGDMAGFEWTAARDTSTSVRTRSELAVRYSDLFDGPNCPPESTVVAFRASGESVTVYVEPIAVYTNVSTNELLVENLTVWRTREPTVNAFGTVHVDNETMTGQITNTRHIDMAQPTDGWEHCPVDNANVFGTTRPGRVEMRIAHATSEGSFTLGPADGPHRWFSGLEPGERYRFSIETPSLSIGGEDVIPQILIGSPSAQAQDAPLNLIPDPKPALGTWQGGGGEGFQGERHSSNGPFNQPFYRIRWTEPSNGSPTFVLLSQSGTSGIQVDPGTQYTFSSHWRIPMTLTTAQPQMRLRWYDAAGTDLGIVSQDLTLPADSEWHRFSWTVAAPAQAQFVRPSLIWQGTSYVDGDYGDVAMAMLTEGSELGHYFDGDWLGEWTGSPNRSASRSNVSRVNQIRDPRGAEPSSWVIRAITDGSFTKEAVPDGGPEVDNALIAEGTDQSGYVQATWTADDAFDRISPGGSVFQEGPQPAGTDFRIGIAISFSKEMAAGTLQLHAVEVDTAGNQTIASSDTIPDTIPADTWAYYTVTGSTTTSNTATVLPRVQAVDPAGVPMVEGDQVRATFALSEVFTTTDSTYFDGTSGNSFWAGEPDNSPSAMATISAESMALCEEPVSQLPVQSVCDDPNSRRQVFEFVALDRTLVVQIVSGETVTIPQGTNWLWLINEVMLERVVTEPDTTPPDAFSEQSRTLYDVGAIVGPEMTGLRRLSCGWMANVTFGFRAGVPFLYRDPIFAGGLPSSVPEPVPFQECADNRSGVRVRQRINLVHNPSVEENTVGWQANGTNAVGTRCQTCGPGPMRGNWLYRAVGGANLRLDFDWDPPSSGPTLEPGGTYTMSVYVSALETGVYAWSADIIIDSQPWHVNTGSVTIVADDGPQWARIEHTFTIPLGSRVSDFDFHLYDSTGNGALFGDVFMIEPRSSAGTPWDETWAGASWWGEPGRSALLLAQRETDPSQDPDCPTPPLPPLPPQVDEGCVATPGSYVRSSFTIEENVVPVSLVAVPVMEFHAGASDVRAARIRFYPNPDDLPPDELDVCAWEGEIIVSYIPAQGVLTIDGVTETATLTMPDGTTVDGTHLLYGTNGSPAQWPEITGGVEWVVTLDLDAADPNLDAFVTVDLAVRD